MKFSVIIPARYASTRLPGKPLADICGKTMIERVYQQATLSNASDVIVATDHQDIADEVQRFGGRVVMTRAEHESGTDRLAEVVTQLSLASDDIVVNVQGDEPMIPPSVINQVAENLHQHTQASIATVSEPIHEVALYQNANAVKVVADVNGMALYFSRASIPWHRDALSDGDTEELTRFLAQDNAVQKHIGIYAYRVDLLHKFVTWPMALIEKIEKLEQLRAMANGCRIHVEEAVEPVPVGIDTEEDLQLARAIFSNKH